jgi:hypothetical protein
LEAASGLSSPYLEVIFQQIQIDVKTAFLNGDFEEEIFMEQSEFFDGTDKVCLLHKGLCGLKQAPRAWNNKFHSFLTSYGLVRSESDHCVYFGQNNSGIIRLYLYVDDGLLCCSKKKIMENMTTAMKQTSEITMGDPSCFVGLQLERDRNKRTISISQSGYINRILSRFGMADCKAAATPGEPGLKLTKAMCSQTEKEKEAMSHVPYREAVGSLNFAMICSRRHIAFEVTRVAAYFDNPGEEHWKRVKRILRYLKGTVGYKLTFGKDASLHSSCSHGLSDALGSSCHIPLVALCDSDYGGNLDDRRSTTGYGVTLAGGLVCWCS